MICGLGELETSKPTKLAESTSINGTTKTISDSISTKRTRRPPSHLNISNTESYTSTSHSPTPKPKKDRISFTKVEKQILESQYAQTPNPTKPLRMDIAKKIGKTERCIQVWFQNRRAKKVGKRLSDRGSRGGRDGRKKKEDIELKKSDVFETGNVSSVVQIKSQIEQANQINPIIPIKLITQINHIAKIQQFPKIDPIPIIVKQISSPKETYPKDPLLELFRLMENASYSSSSSSSQTSVQTSSECQTLTLSTGASATQYESLISTPLMENGFDYLMNEEIDALLSDPELFLKWLDT